MFKAIIKKYCHAELVCARTNVISVSSILSKKSAMFGLDARIALAIFGALSVITGAVLYSAISNAKATAKLTEMQEFAKAWEQYYLDTGSPLGVSSTYNFNIVDLYKDPGVKGWKGPYLQANIFPNDVSNKTWVGKTATEGFLMRNLSTSSAWTTTGNVYCTNASMKCGVWLNSTGNESTDMAEIIDKIVDNGDGQTVGHFRWWNNNDGTTNKNRYELLLLPIKNHN